MTRDKQQRFLTQLSAHFDVAIARISWRKTGVSHVYLEEMAIVLSDASGLGGYFVCAHEFAHLLSESRRPGFGQRHDRHFVVALLDILRWAGLEATYPWHRDYYGVHAWAIKLGVPRCC